MTGEKCACEAPLRYVLSASGWLVRCTRCGTEWIEKHLSQPAPPPPKLD